MNEIEVVSKIEDRTTILVVEDNIGLRHLIQKRLQREHFNVEVVDSGQEALTRLKARQDVILLLDYKLPDMTGKELIELLTNKKRTIPFVVMTGHGDERIAVEMMKLGARDYLVKDHSLLEVLPQIMEQVFTQVSTEKKLSQVSQALHESEERFKLLFNSGTDAIFVQEMKNGIPGSLIEVNDIACQRLGYTREELLRMSLNRIEFHEDPDMECFLKEKPLTQRHLLYEAVQVTRSGEQISVENNAHLIDLAGESAVLFISRDITQRKQLEDQLRHAQKMEAIGKLAGGVAHDFNNLLTAIMGYSELMLIKMGQKNPYRKIINEIKKASERAASLTQQLLAFSRKQILKPRILNLNRVVDSMGKMLKRIIGEDIQLIIQLPKRPWKVKADSGQLEQIIVNLSVNAVDAMPGGGILTIKTENKKISEDESRLLPSSRPGNFVRLSISDNGQGIDKKIISHIFEPFFTTKKSGTGLGLSVVYGIVKQHNGWIHVDSDGGKGTTFTIYFPASTADKEERVEQSTLPLEFTGNGERILFIEDEGGVRKVAAKALLDYGYRVSEAATAREGLEIFKKERFHLVVSDIVLPDKNGIELTNEIYIRQPDIKIILTSGYVDQRAHWPEVIAKGIPFLQKPYSMGDLLELVRSLLEERSESKMKEKMTVSDRENQGGGKS
jgi:two-component system cell cycle sensor histidine kinase/response regulator CckA